MWRSCGSASLDGHWGTNPSHRETTKPPHLALLLEGEWVDGEHLMAATVLVVEDEAKLRDLLRSYFEREGFVVLSTASGSEAIDLARRGAPDLVVLDLGLPDLPGEEVASSLRTFMDVPILMLTAKAGEPDRIRGLELGADDYMTKPFSPREFDLACAGDPASRAQCGSEHRTRLIRRWRAPDRRESKRSGR